MQRTIRHLLQKRYPIKTEELKYFSPYNHQHINFYGHFPFNLEPEEKLITLEKDFEPIEISPSKQD